MGPAVLMVGPVMVQEVPMAPDLSLKLWVFLLNLLIIIAISGVRF